MAMLDSFFSKGFKAAKCKTLLKLTIPRIKLLRNRREIQVKQMRRDIAKLLETGQEATARIRVEHIIREEKMMAAQEIVELFCELITVRLPIIEAQRECPLDLKEAISSVCFAAPRCADLPELQEVQMLFAGKYGREFVSAATELMPECGVNRQLVELLSVRAPAPDVKLKLLKEIAEEHELDWDPSASESELFKPHEDLLNGPTQTVNISQASLPKEKHDQIKPTTSKPSPAHEHSDSEEDFDVIDFPQVPKQQPLQSNKGTVSAPEMLPFPASALSEDDQDEQFPCENNDKLSQLRPENESRERPSARAEDKQFVPFMYSPSQSLCVKEQNSPPPVSKKENGNVDLQDILAAAQMAAESAERAAIAARSAASIAQLRINELVKRSNDDDNPFYFHKPEPDLEEKGVMDLRNSPGDSSSQNDIARPSYDDADGDFDSSRQGNNVCSHGSFRKPQRLPSMDDESYLSYPNLFTSQRSNLSSSAQSFKDSK